ncbi:MAG: glutamate mutase L [Candidatus Izemoplasma sp.]
MINMIIDVLVAEIGSTTTIVNAFTVFSDKPRFINRGISGTTVGTDVNIGLDLAIEDLKTNMGIDILTYKEMFATSSAAGGLKMTVHGLVYEMTVKASKEAALNAGANIHLVTANKIIDDDLEQILKIKPNIILIAGGTDYGERKNAQYNANQILKLNLKIPIIYAGNIENHSYMKKLFAEYDSVNLLKIVENVYPRVDYMNILPLRKVIYQTFEENIIHAKGMNRIFDKVNQRIMPTPGSVMEATMMLNERIGNIITIDVGGATTDIHSISEPSEEYEKYQEGESKLKRTVEGDLGVFINHKNVISLFDKEKLLQKLNISSLKLDEVLVEYKYIPVTDIQKDLVDILTSKCTTEALDRHIGDLKRVFTTNGQKIIPDGKDLTKVEFIILTGGALLHHSSPELMIKQYLSNSTTKLTPKENITILKDSDYVMASVGVLSLKYQKEAYQILKNSLKIGDEYDVAKTNN